MKNSEVTGSYLKGKHPVHTHNKKYITFPLNVAPRGDCDLDLSLLLWWAQKQIHGFHLQTFLSLGLSQDIMSKKYFKEILQNFSCSLQVIFSRTLIFFLSSFLFKWATSWISIQKPGCKIPIKAIPVEQQDYFTCFSGCKSFLGVPG